VSEYLSCGCISPADGRSDNHLGETASHSGVNGGQRESISQHYSQQQQQQQQRAVKYVCTELL